MLVILSPMFWWLPNLPLHLRSSQIVMTKLSYRGAPSFEIYIWNNRRTVFRHCYIHSTSNEKRQPGSGRYGGSKRVVGKKRGWCGGNGRRWRREKDSVRGGEVWVRLVHLVSYLLSHDRGECQGLKLDLCTVDIRPLSILTHPRNA